MVSEKYDDDFTRKIDILQAIVGGAPHGKWWWESFDPSKPGADLVKHFEKTVDRIDINQICEKVTLITEAIEVYASVRKEGPAKDALLKHAFAACTKARVCQLEVVIFRTVKKSRKPAERIRTALTGFSTEEDSGGRRNAFECIGAPVRAYLTTQYGITGDVEALAAEPGKECTDGGVVDADAGGAAVGGA